MPILLVLLPIGLGLDDAAAKCDLLGTWQVVSYEVEGKAVAESDFQVTFNKDGSGHVSFRNGEPFPLFGFKKLRFSISIDPRQAPKSIDIRKAHGDGKGESVEQEMKGIYVLDGDGNRLKICYNPSARPQEFTSKSPMAQLLVLKRIGK